MTHEIDYFEHGKPEACEPTVEELAQQSMDVREAEILRLQAKAEAVADAWKTHTCAHCGRSTQLVPIKGEPTNGK